MAGPVRGARGPRSRRRRKGHDARDPRGRRPDAGAGAGWSDRERVLERRRHRQPTGAAVRRLQVRCPRPDEVVRASVRAARAGERARAGVHGDRVDRQPRGLALGAPRGDPRADAAAPDPEARGPRRRRRLPRERRLGAHDRQLRPLRRRVQHGGRVSQQLGRLRVIAGETHDLERTAHLLAWDQETMLPPEGARARAEQWATIGRVVHGRLVSDELARLLDELRPEEEAFGPESDEAALIRVLRREHEKARRVPTELRAELSRAGALGLGAWLQAREQRDFEVLRPHLERQLELKRRYIDCFEPYDDPYDVLLDDYEQGMTTAETERVLEHLKRELVPLVQAVRDAGAVEPLQGPFPVERQGPFVGALLERLGFDERSWRLDRSEHPFTAGLSIGDIRLTTRFQEHNLSGVFASMHEFGHGLYERQVAPELDRTPLAGGASAALHESQSRMWENLVGRSRPFWTWAYDDLRAALPDALRDVDLDRFYRAINRLRPSLVRVDADEITYNLHIVLRFELERDLLAGRLEVRDMPAAFDERMVSYLGLEPPDVTLGVLQDIHWGDATFGYFPTYSLGNVMSVQIWERARGDVGELDAQLERGEFGELREWLREHLHRHGRKFTPGETLRRAAGAEIDPEPYVRYLKGKLGEVAGVAVP